MVESGQEKDKLINRLQQVHAASRGTIMDNNRLRDEADELKNQLAKKKGIHNIVLVLLFISKQKQCQK